MKSIVLISIFVLLSTLSYAQKLSGRWQIQTSVISDAYLGNYLFTDSTFEYIIDGYDGLNPIQVLGGTYFIKSDTLFFTVKYIKKQVGGKLERSEIYSDNDSWALEGGKIETEILSPPIHAAATIKRQNNVLWIDERKFFKLNTEDEK
jgi:hypothetical protein